MNKEIIVMGEMNGLSFLRKLRLKENPVGIRTLMSPPAGIVFSGLNSKNIFGMIAPSAFGKLPTLQI